MEIRNIEMFIDGGTIEIETDKEVYSIDNRLFTEEKAKEIAIEIVDSDDLINYNNSYQQRIIDSLTESYNLNKE